MLEVGDSAAPLPRRLTADAAGSARLTATVVGSGIMAERLANGNEAIALLANTVATVAALATLIALLGPLSGAHFNPAVSWVEAARGRLTWGDALRTRLFRLSAAAQERCWPTSCSNFGPGKRPRTSEPGVPNCFRKASRRLGSC